MIPLCLSSSIQITCHQFGPLKVSRKIRPSHTHATSVKETMLLVNKENYFMNIFLEDLILKCHLNVQTHYCFCKVTFGCVTLSCISFAFQLISSFTEITPYFILVEFFVHCFKIKILRKFDGVRNLFDIYEQDEIMKLFLPLIRIRQARKGKKKRKRKNSYQQKCSLKSELS